MRYTNGKKFLVNGKPYTGIYTKGPDNNYYTGESYIFGISKFLTPIIVESNGSLGINYKISNSFEIRYGYVSYGFC
jgi:hypothetical protein